MRHFLPAVIVSGVIVSGVIVGSWLAPWSAAADEKAARTLITPTGWSGETIQLPPGFAPKMTWAGTEVIRFAPGMFKPASDSFFSYAFVFDLAVTADVGQTSIQTEMLKYYRGLASALLKNKKVAFAPDQFTLALKPSQPSPESIPSFPHTERWLGTLDWTEPFATKDRQSLRMEFHSWKASGSRFLFVCVSPHKRDAAIWKELHRIRAAFFTEHPPLNQ